jgi:hypothetical protein
MAEVERSWFPKAAMIWCDMERGLYDWGTRKPPKNADGTLLVVKKQILKDCGITTNYGLASQRIWQNPVFLSLVDKENRRRDLGITSMVEEIEKVTGPLIELRTKMQENVAAVFEKAPDDDDPEALSPKDYVSQALGWSRYIDELTGRGESQKQQGIEAVMGALVQRDQITGNMVDQALELVKEHRRLQDAKLVHAGMLRDGELE